MLRIFRVGVITRASPQGGGGLKWIQSHHALAVYRSAPAGQMVRLHALGEFQRMLQRLHEFIIYLTAFHPVTKEVGPEEFTEWRRVFRKAAGAAQFAGQ